MHSRFRRWAGLAALALILAAAMVLVPRPAAAQMELTGKWTGMFEFITLGKRAGTGPAAVLEHRLQGLEGEPAKLGEGPIDVQIKNRAGDHFFGRWVIGKQSAQFVCTMRDEHDFICGGQRSNAVGTVLDAETLRMCWSASGAEATSGCARLTRPG
jgi:hypothetical protein